MPQVRERFGEQPLGRLGECKAERHVNQQGGFENGR